MSLSDGWLAQVPLSHCQSGAGQGTSLPLVSIMINGHFLPLSLLSSLPFFLLILAPPFSALPSLPLSFLSLPPFIPLFIF